MMRRFQAKSLCFPNFQCSTRITRFDNAKEIEESDYSLISHFGANASPRASGNCYFPPIIPDRHVRVIEE